MLVDTILSRLIEENAKGRVEKLLAKVKEEKDLGKNAFRTRGSKEELSGTITELIRTGYLSIERLARLLDDVEENGGQHIFPFEATEEGKKAIKVGKLRKLFHPTPAITKSLYADIPASKRTYFVENGDELIIKQIYCGAFWEIDQTLCVYDAETPTPC
jgi:hypothetical protein